MGKLKTKRKRKTEKEEVSKVKYKPNNRLFMPHKETTIVVLAVLTDF